MRRVRDESYPHYPTALEKELLAKEIVENIPPLRLSDRRNPLGFEHLLDPRSGNGFITDRCKTIQRNLEPGLRRYCRRERLQFQTENLDEPECAEETERASYDGDVLWLKANRRNPMTEKEIFLRMKRTTRLRRMFMKGQLGTSDNNAKCPTVSELLETFPRFIDTEGLIDQEFEEIGKRPNILLENWDKIAKLSCGYLRRSVHVPDEDCQNLPDRNGMNEDDAALVTLSELVSLFPPTSGGGTSKNKRKKVSSEQALRLLIQEENNCVNMEQYLLRKKDGSVDVPNQPFLLIVRSGKNPIAQIFLIIEYFAISVPSVRKGFDLLFKSFFVFDVVYPDALKAFYGFFELLHDSEADVSKSVREKFNLLFH